jgi:RimJ/RimL family protein N-acetyltransferase
MRDGKASYLESTAMNLTTSSDREPVAGATSPAASRRTFLAPEPILHEASVGIRPFTAGDVHDLFDAARESREELSTWMVWCRPDYSCEDSAAFISTCDTKWHRRESYNFVIFDTVDGTFLGSVALNQINWTHNYANIGYWVRSDRVGQGVASAAVRLISTFGFIALGLGRLELVVQIENRGSRRQSGRHPEKPFDDARQTLRRHPLLAHCQRRQPEARGGRPRPRRCGTGLDALIPSRPVQEIIHG